MATGPNGTALYQPPDQSWGLAIRTLMTLNEPHILIVSIRQSTSVSPSYSFYPLRLEDVLPCLGLCRRPSVSKGFVDELI